MVTRAGHDWNIAEGDEVFAADGEKLGEVTEVFEDHLTVKKGWLFSADHYVPLNAVSNYDGGRVQLSVGKDQAGDQGWDRRPEGFEDRPLGMAATGAAGSIGLGAAPIVAAGGVAAPLLTDQSDDLLSPDVVDDIAPTGTDGDSAGVR